MNLTEITAIIAIVVSIAAIIFSVVTTYKLKNKDMDFDRRKFFVAILWDKLIAVRGINPTHVTDDLVMNVVNTLELVAICWENNIIDKNLILNSFGNSYCQRVKEIDGIIKGHHANYDNVINKIGMSGPDLLDYSEVIRPVCAQIRNKLDK